MKTLYVYYYNNREGEYHSKFPLHEETMKIMDVRWGYEILVRTYPWEDATPEEQALNEIAVIVHDTSWCIDPSEGMKRVGHVLEGMVQG